MPITISRKNPHTRKGLGNTALSAGHHECDGQRLHPEVNVVKSARVGYSKMLLGVLPTL